MGVDICPVDAASNVKAAGKIGSAASACIIAETESTALMERCETERQDQQLRR